MLHTLAATADPTVARLAKLMRTRQPVVALTGAGTASGIPDFRSPTGWWARFDPRLSSSLRTFRRNPGRVWELHGPRLRCLADARPNPVHEAPAQTEQAGLLAAVVTQNSDMLHAKAGSREATDVRGDLRLDGDPATALTAIAALLCA